MFKIFSLIKSYKTISSIIAVIALIGGVALGWNSLKSSYVEQGYHKAKSEYNEMLIEQMNKSTESFERQLVEMRTKLQEQALKEKERILKDNKVDKEVVTVTEFIEREVYVKAECDTVDNNLVRMFNESIKRVNGGTEDKP